MKFLILFISILCIIFPSAGIMEAEGFWASLFKLTAKGAQELTQQGMKAIDDLNLNPYSQFEKQIQDIPVTIKEKPKSSSNLSPGKHSDFIIEEAGEVAVALMGDKHSDLSEEVADLLYHILVGLEISDTNLEETWKILNKRNTETSS